VLPRALTHRLAVGLLLLGGCVATAIPARCQNQDSDQITRKLKSKMAPAYPELARRMNITGVVKIQITVDKTGTVKNPKLVGGHPILANAAMDALKKWRYEGASDETTGIVEFHFDGTQ
jgi:TonB family protein